MAIQNRRGNIADFDKNKMLAGEFAYALDVGELYYCVAPGNVKRCATKEELQQILTSAPEAYTALQQLIIELENETVSTGILADISNLQLGKLDKIGDSKDNTVTFTEAATETDIVTGESHTTLFGKILKSIKTFRSAIGTLSSLKTTNKTSLVGAINEQNDSLAKLKNVGILTTSAQAVAASNEVVLSLVYVGATNYLSSPQVITLPANSIFKITVKLASVGDCQVLFKNANSTFYSRIIDSGTCVFTVITTAEEAFNLSVVSGGGNLTENYKNNMILIEPLN